MRRIIYLVLGLTLIAALISCGDSSVTKENLIEKIGNEINDLNEYEVDGVLSVTRNNEEIIYDISVSYLEPDYYKVTLVNETGSNKQVIVKNDEGVFVLTPTLNKSFKFQSDWPTNTTNAYIYQLVIADLIDNDSLVITEDESNFYIESELTEQVNTAYKKQKVTINKETLTPKEVTILGENDNILMKVMFNEFDFKPGLQKGDFDEKSSMQTAILEYGDSMVSYEDREFTTPTYVAVGSYIGDEVLTDELSVIQYDGDTKYTVVQRFVNFDDKEESLRVYGDLVMVNGTYGALTENSLTYYENGIEYMVYSNNMPVSEMVSVVESFVVVSET